MRWLVWLLCFSVAHAAVADLDILRDATAGFARAVEPRTFQFPRDHGPHPDFHHEWWYVTGNLDSDTGERFGFELTIFRVGLAPPSAHGAAAVANSDGAATAGEAAQPKGPRASDAAGVGAVRAGAVRAGAVRAGAAGVDAVRAGAVGARVASGAAEASAPGVSAWRTRELYAAHFAITDVARGTFKFADQYSRGALGLAGAQAEPFHVWLNDWELGSSLHARGQGYELTLDIGALGEPVLNGDRGLSHKSSEPGTASYYYSIPRIPVRGKLVHAGVSSSVHGLAWLDREWGSGSLGAKEQGWDWFAFQLDDGSALMFYSLRKHDGTRDPNSSGTWIDARGQGHLLGADQVLIDVSGHWISPRGGRYPSHWRVRVPAAGLDVDVQPVLADQELGTRPRYWEGSVDLRGRQSGRDIAGRGYVELVGYDE